jgi:glutathione S-transferase
VLAPVGDLQRYRALEWLAWSASWVQPNLGPLFHPGATPEQREAAQKAIDAFAAKLAGKSFVLGDQFSIADSYTIVFYRWAQSFKLDLRGLKHNVEKLVDRPAVQRALEAEGIKIEI